MKVKNLESEIDGLKQKRGDFENKKGYRKKKVMELQDRLAGEGGTFAKKQNELNIKKSKLESQIEQKYETIRETMFGVTPIRVRS